jgi:MFS family permease
LAPEKPEPGRPKRNLDWLWLTLPVALIAACSELGYAVLNGSVLPVYIKQALGLDTAVYSLIMVPFFISEAFFKGPLGLVADRIGRKPLMVIGPSLSIFTPLLFMLIHYRPDTINALALIAFGFLRLLDGLGAAALWPAMFAYVGDVVRQEKRAAAMGLLNVTYMLGLALGFLAGGFVDDTFGPVLSGKATFTHQMIGVVYRFRKHVHIARQPSLARIFHNLTQVPPPHIFPPAYYYPSFYLASALFAAAVCIALLAIQRRSASREGSAQDTHHSVTVTWETFLSAVKTVPGMMLVAFITFLGIGCIMLQVKYFALDEFGISETTFGLLVVGPALVIGAIAVPLGHLSDRWGKVRSIRLGFILGAAGMWLIVVFYRNPHFAEAALAVAGSLLGIGFVMAFPAWMALMTEVCRAGQRGTVTGAVSTAQGVGALMGVLIGGFLYSHAPGDSHIKHIAPFFASAVLLSLSVLLAFVFVHADKGHKGRSEATV